MKAIVRDDIIGLESFVEAEFKYKKYIEILSECGGYCFLDQFERLMSEDGGKYLAKKMEDAGFIKSEYFSNYKYIRLTANALKYIYYKDDERDFSDIPKNKIPIKNLSKKPSEKTLFTSTMYFELAVQNSNVYTNKIILKNFHRKYLEDTLKIDNKSKIKDLESQLIKHKENLNIILSDFNKAHKSANEINISNKNLVSLKNMLEEKRNELDNAKIIRRDNDISAIDEYISMVDKSIEINNNAINHLVDIQNDRDLEKTKISKIEDEINRLKNQELINERADNVIDKIIKMRDISKVICFYTPSDNSLFFLSAFVSNHKSNYDEIINDTIHLFKQELDVDVLEVKVLLYSIKDNDAKVKSLFKRLDKKVKKDVIYNYEDRRIKYSYRYGILKELQKYFDRVSDSINYIKDQDVEVFENLRKRLSPKN